MRGRVFQTLVFVLFAGVALGFSIYRYYHPKDWLDPNLRAEVNKLKGQLDVLDKHFKEVETATTLLKSGQLENARSVLEPAVSAARAAGLEPNRRSGFMWGEELLLGLERKLGRQEAAEQIVAAIKMRHPQYDPAHADEALQVYTEILREKPATGAGSQPIPAVEAIK